MKKIALILIILLIGLSACTKSLLDGIVVEKRYTPALTYGQYGPPYDEYMLKIEGEVHSKTKSKKVYVTKQVFDNIEIGDIYTILD